MNKIIKQIADKWHIQPGATVEAIFQLEEQTRYKLPIDYIKFIKWSNGGEGFIGNNYLSLWKGEEIIELNKDYAIHQYLSDHFIAFGSDGGSLAYLFDFREKHLEPAVVSIPFGYLDRSEIEYLANSFSDFMKLLLS